MVNISKHELPAITIYTNVCNFITPNNILLHIFKD